MIDHAGKHRAVDRLFQNLSGPGRIFLTMDEAREAIRRHRPETVGHLDEKPIASNFSLSSKIQMSDYPVLFWLRTILCTENIDLFDFGGGLGQTFVIFHLYLPENALARWTVQDLPSVVSLAKEKFFPQGLPPGLEFTGGMACSPDCNVVLAAGAFHYWEGSIADFFRALGTKPAHLIINRSPIRSQGATFCTVQEGTEWAVPCQVRSVENLEAEMHAEGYTLVESWTDLEKSLIIPLFPAYSCPYRGLFTGIRTRMKTTLF
jgi:putative methyltransferase (TIGR04325 family)